MFRYRLLARDRSLQQLVPPALHVALSFKRVLKRVRHGSFLPFCGEPLPGTVVPLGRLGASLSSAPSHSRTLQARPSPAELLDPQRARTYPQRILTTRGSSQ
jgi:hypothetical protein